MKIWSCVRSKRRKEITFGVFRSLLNKEWLTRLHLDEGGAPTLVHHLGKLLPCFSLARWRSIGGSGRLKWWLQWRLMVPTALLLLGEVTPDLLSSLLRNFLPAATPILSASLPFSFPRRFSVLTVTFYLSYSPLSCFPSRTLPPSFSFAVPQNLSQFLALGFCFSSSALI